MTAKAKRPQVPRRVHVVWLWNGIGWREELRSYNYNSARQEALQATAGEEGEAMTTRTITAKPSDHFWMTLAIDPLTNRPTFVVPLRLPSRVTIEQPRKHTYLVCRCGKRRRFTLFYASDKRRPKKTDAMEKAVCVTAQTWLDDHGCGKRKAGRK
jgi:hypothetical protein